MKTLLCSLVAAGSFTMAARAQTEVTITTGAGNSQVVWYSMQNGEVATAPLNEWDLAFEITGLTSSIRVNTAKGLEVYETSVAFSQWESLTEPDVDNWTRLMNDETDWSAGALNHGGDGGMNMGWGGYSMVTHKVSGTKIYALKQADEHWIKLRIDTLASSTYYFTYADLDGENTHHGAVVKSNFSGKNFGYWSFATHAPVDHEPLAANWDLVFTKYTADLGIPYTVSGVLQNVNRPVERVADLPPDEAGWSPEGFDEAINVIGYNWKSYNFGANAYTTDDSLTFFAKDGGDNIWKLVFTGYVSATGAMTFTQEMESSTGVQETAQAPSALRAYPNPATAGRVTLTVDAPVQQGVFRIFSTTGQQVLEQQWSGLSGMDARTVALDGLTQGLYILRFDAPGFSTAGKLVIE